MKYEILNARSGDPTLSVETEDGRNLILHSMYDPKSEAKEWVNTNTININVEQPVFLVFGLGLGYHIRELKNRFNNAIILVLEPVLPQIPEQKEVIGNLDRVYILYDCTRSKLAGFLNAFIPDYALGDLTILYHLQSLRAFPNKYQAVISAAKRGIGAVDTNINTTLYLGKQWTQNMLRNLKLLSKVYPVKLLDGLFTKKPGIIVSAGPSLDKNVYLLPKIKGKAVIISVGTAVKAVLRHGVQPDIVVSIDGGEPNYKHFEGLQGKLTAPLVCDPSVYPRILDEYTGPIIMALVNPYLKRWFGGLFRNLGILHSGPSVANVAFSLALLLGLDPIIFIGQDLAYPGQKSHASGTFWANRNPIRENGMLSVEDINGNPVLTDKSLYSMLIWFEEAISHMNEEIRIIDATEGGARIAGTQIMTLAEVMKNYLVDNFNPANAIENLLSRNQPLYSLAKEFKTLCNVAKNDLSNLLKVLESGQRLAKQLEDAYSKGLPTSGKLKRLNKKLDEIDLEIKQYENAIPLLELCFAPVNWLIRRKYKAVENETPIQKGRRVARMSEALYKGLFDSATTVLRFLEE